MIKYVKVIKMKITTYKNFEVSHSLPTNLPTYTGVHYHDDYELYYLLNGSTSYFIEDEIFRVKKGDFVFIGKGIIHKTDSEDAAAPERILLSFGDDILTPSAKEHINTLTREKVIYVPPKNLYEIEEVLFKIEKEYASQNLYKREMINLYILEILALLCRLRQESVPKDNETEKIIHSVSEYINSNFGKDLSLKNLSHTFGISQAHLSRKFKAVSGMGLCEYITYVRVHNGARLLEEGGYPLTKIASVCGFNDSNYFSSVFKKIKGTTPHKWRKMKGADKNGN